MAVIFFLLAFCHSFMGAFPFCHFQEPGFLFLRRGGCAIWLILNSEDFVTALSVRRLETRT